MTLPKILPGHVGWEITATALILNPLGNEESSFNWKIVSDGFSHESYWIRHIKYSHSIIESNSTPDLVNSFWGLISSFSLEIKINLSKFREKQFNYNNNINNNNNN